MSIDNKKENLLFDEEEDVTMKQTRAANLRAYLDKRDRFHGG
ncbi:hypothetical protein VTP01DRAFT_8079, partial [Rhizomucor pusillus]